MYIVFNAYYTVTYYQFLLYIGVANENLNLAMKIACDEAANLLVNQWGFTYEDAFIFLSVTCDLGIAQAVHPSTGTVIAKMKIPKINACPKPFNN